MIAVPAKPESVRLATRADEDALYSLLVTLHRENPLGLPYDPALVIAAIECGTRPDPATRSRPSDMRRAIIGVIDGENGVLAGSAGIFIEPASWYTNVYAARELWLYVRASERRGLRHYDALFRFSLWARSEMERLIHAETPDYPYPFPLLTGPTSRERLDAKARLWARYTKKIGELFEAA